MPRARHHLLSPRGHNKDTSECVHVCAFSAVERSAVNSHNAGRDRAACKGKCLHKPTLHGSVAPGEDCWPGGTPERKSELFGQSYDPLVSAISGFEYSLLGFSSRSAKPRIRAFRWSRKPTWPRKEWSNSGAGLRLAAQILSPGNCRIEQLLRLCRARSA